jgi:2-iminobutanoate/2-iminopropanoate deaminase
MPSQEAIRSNAAPTPVGPYSQAVRVGDLVFCSGQVPIDPATGALIAGDVAAQTRQVLANLGAVLAAAGLGLDAIVKTTIFLADIADFAAVNPVYGEFFTGVPPARSTFAVAALPLGARVEIEAVATAV